VDLAGACIVVTGGGRGIGRALCERFAAEGARGIVVADLDTEPAEDVALRVGGSAMRCDVSDAADVERLVEQATAAFGPIDLFCSNAGIVDPGSTGDLDTPPDVWARVLGVNLMAHVHAARAVVPSMVERGRGYLLQTVSAAGLVTGPSPVTYAVSKHAAIGFAEWLVLNYGDRGIGVSCLCPTAVDTRMLAGNDAGPTERAAIARNLGSVLSPDAVAACVVEGLEREAFLILPEPRVGESFLHKAQDYDRWLVGTRRRVTRMKTT
jgi:NAD(P)-dependent dehydrogenase (short-subunit alcohol dehydrogenase family)